MFITNRLKMYLNVFVALLVTVVIVYFQFKPSESKIEKDDADEEVLTSLAPEVLAGQLADVLTVEEEFPHKIKRNIPLYTYLVNEDISSLDIIQMVRAAKAVKNLSRLMPGTRFQISKDSKGGLIGAKFRFSAVEKLVLIKNKGNWEAKVVNEPVNIKHVSYSGHVSSSLWESALEADMNPYLIFSMAEIFGWEVDFNREVQVGDTWRITAEQKFVGDQAVGWGSVLAAEYVNQGQSHKAALFRMDDEDIGYYNLQGENLRKMFLKSPLKFGRITSHFNRRRFHPRLRIIRPHNGVDYGAPIGTPVRSVANGIVTFARYAGGGGRVVKVRHNSTYQTAYKHLSRYGKGIRKGKKVRQGQIIAYVGNTGLSTGPHLHYEFYYNGRYVDPLRQKFPSAEPIANEYKSLFLKQANKYVALLPDWKKNEFSMEPEKTWAQHLVPEIRQNYYSIFKSDSLAF